MICCAFAVLIVLQLLAPARWLNRALTGDRIALDAAALWAPGSQDEGPEPSAAKRPLRAPLNRGAFAAVIGVQIFLLGALAPLEFPIIAEAGRALLAAHDAVCGALGVSS